MGIKTFNTVDGHPYIFINSRLSRLLILLKRFSTHTFNIDVLLSFRSVIVSFQSLSLGLSLILDHSYIIHTFLIVVLVTIRGQKEISIVEAKVAIEYQICSVTSLSFPK